jgi:glutamate carboxypeptidase
MFGSRARGGKLLRYLPLVESPSDEPAALERILTMLVAELKSPGMPVRRLPGRASGGLLHARQLLRPARSPLQLLIGHCGHRLACRNSRHNAGVR